jgi:nitroreductase
MDLDKAIQQRNSIRKFQKKKPDWRDIIECVDACRYAPMAGKIFTPRFILINDRQKINKIAEASQQDFISQTSYVLVVCSKTDSIINLHGERAKIYVRQQFGAAIQNFLLKIEEKKLSTCWVGHFVDEQIKRILQIPEDIQIEALFPIGYAFPVDKKKKSRKTDFDKVMFFHEYGNKRMKTPRMPYT